jgi:DNA-directed RNA polymerase subunit RPC12/RpoP
MIEICYHCRVGKIEVPELETSDRTYAYCPYCGAVRLFYEPQDYQKEFHTDKTMIKANFGKELPNYNSVNCWKPLRA